MLHTDASHNVSAQSDLWFWRCRKCEKLNNGRTEKLKAPGELIIVNYKLNQNDSISAQLFASDRQLEMEKDL